MLTKILLSKNFANLSKNDVNARIFQNQALRAMIHREE